MLATRKMVDAAYSRWKPYVFIYQNYCIVNSPLIFPLDDVATNSIHSIQCNSATHTRHTCQCKKSVFSLSTVCSRQWQHFCVGTYYALVAWMRPGHERIEIYLPFCLLFALYVTTHIPIWSTRNFVGRYMMIMMMPLRHASRENRYYFLFAIFHAIANSILRVSVCPYKGSGAGMTIFHGKNSSLAD